MTDASPAPQSASAPLMLSVSGLRGLIGQSLTPDVAVRYGVAVGQWFKSQSAGGVHAPHIVVGRDSRPSGPMIEAAVVAGLASVGCRVTRLGIVTTPGVAIMAEHLHASGGIVITASHNPIIWNGIKTLRHDGVAPSADQAARIIDLFRGGEGKFVSVDALQPIESDHSSAQVHVSHVLKVVNIDAIRKRRPTIVLDSVHGAGGPETAMLLRELGVETVHLYAEPTGQFPHNPEPTRDNLVGLCDAVRKHGADVGFAQDPDADRLAIVDEQGRYIGEEYTLALAVEHVLAQAGKSANHVVAANLSTSRMIDDIAASHGARVVRTSVGEANVAAAMRETNATVGGEGNGGVIWPAVVHVRDSLAGIAIILEMLAQRNETISAAVARIPSYCILKDKLAIKPGMTDGLAGTLSTAFPNASLDDRDGVRLDWPDRWVHVRASNTEPILRIIAEAPREDNAKALIASVRKVLGLD